MDAVLTGDLIYVCAFCLAGLVFALGPFLTRPSDFSAQNAANRQ